MALRLNQYDGFYNPINSIISFSKSLNSKWISSNQMKPSNSLTLNLEQLLLSIIIINLIPVWKIFFCEKKWWSQMLIIKQVMIYPYFLNIMSKFFVMVQGWIKSVYTLKGTHELSVCSPDRPLIWWLFQYSQPMRAQIAFALDIISNIPHR